MPVVSFMDSMSRAMTVGTLSATLPTPEPSPPMMVILSIWARGSAILPAISWMSISAMAALLYFW